MNELAEFDRGSVSPYHPSVRVAAIWLLVIGCGGDDDEGEASVSEPVQVVPFGSTPAGVELGAASSNADVVRHAGRTWLAFRTAASWFADDEARIVVVSSTGAIRWEHEATFETGEELGN